MRVAFFSSRNYDRTYFEQANHAGRHELVFLEPRLTQQTVALAQGFDAVCGFVNDQLGPRELEQLASLGVRFLVLRSAGFNHVDLETANRLGIPVARVPAYSPHSVAEHTVAMILALNRHIVRASSRVREGNFSLEGLLGFDLHGRTVGIIGTGKIGAIVAHILAGFGCRIVAHDIQKNAAVEALGGSYIGLDTIFRESDILTLHCPLTKDSYHLVNERTLGLVRPGIMLINTSRGALVDTRAAIDGLKSGKIGYLGLDVYEEESELFFEDKSHEVIHDDVFARLLTFPNVLVTGHQAFFTREALEAIAATTVANLDAFEQTGESPNQVRWESS